MWEVLWNDLDKFGKRLSAHVGPRKHANNEEERDTWESFI